jgi:hypothetical protein
MSVSPPERSTVFARREDRRGRLHREARDDRLPGRDAAENAAGMVRQEFSGLAVLHAHLVGVLLAGQRGAAKPAPISTPLTALMLIIALASSVELAVDRRAPAGRHALGDDLDHRADG